MLSTVPIAAGSVGGRVKYFCHQAVYEGRLVSKSMSGTVKYYAEGEKSTGRWVGTGASNLALVGDVSEDMLTKLLDFQHPITGEYLQGRAPHIQLRTKQRWSTDNETGQVIKSADPAASPIDATVRAYDMTFSAPKSLSILAFCASDETRATVIEAHREATNVALKWVEEQALRTRRGLGGKVAEDVKGLMAAAFDHAVSREGDPQLHTHVVTSNLVQAASDGTWLTIDGFQLMKLSALAGTIYAAELRRLATERLGVRWGTVHNGLAEVVDIDKALLLEMSKRSQQMDAELGGAGRAGASRAAKQAAVLKTRKDKEELDVESRTAAWEATLVKFGLTAQKLDDMVKRGEQAEQLSPELLQQIADDTLSSSGRSSVLRDNASFELRQIWRKIADQIPATAGLSGLNTAVDFAMNDSRIRRVQGFGAPSWNGKWSTDEVIVMELDQLVERARALQDKDTLALDATRVESLIEANNLSDDQAILFRQLAMGGRGLEVVVAPAGAGKTYTMSVVRASFEELGFNVVGVALANQAARELQSAGIASTSLRRTCARLDAGGYAAGNDANGQPNWVDFKFDAKTVVVIDEAGMISTPELADLLTRIDESGAKAIIVGDNRQLSPIGQGGALKLLAAELSDVNLVDSTVRARAEWEREAQLEWRKGKIDVAFPQYLAHDRLVVGTDGKALRGQIIERWTSDYDARATRGVAIDSELQEIEKELRIAQGNTKLALATKEAARARLRRLQANRAKKNINEYSTVADSDIEAALVAYTQSRENLSRMREVESRVKEQHVEIKSEHTYLKEGAETLMIAARREDVWRLNVAAQDNLKARGKLTGFYAPGTAYASNGQRIGDYQLYVGERIVLQENDASKGVNNGQRGYIERVSPSTGDITVKFDNGTKAEIPGIWAREGKIAPAYAITGHKSQGATADRSIVYADTRCTKEWMYVAATRGRDAVNGNTIFFQADSGQEVDAMEQLRSAMGRVGEKITAAEYSLEMIDALGEEKYTEILEAVYDAAAREGREATRGEVVSEALLSIQGRPSKLIQSEDRSLGQGRSRSI